MFYVAMDMHMFLMGWYKKFPTFRTRDLFLTGESYAGKDSIYMSAIYLPKGSSI